MLFIQKWKKNSFEHKYLSHLQNKIMFKPQLNLYLGFDYGFFCGLNIYYSSEKGKKYANILKEKFNKKNIKVRLMTNIESNYDIILLLGYSNLKKERLKLIIFKNKIVNVTSFFQSIF